MSNYTYMVTNKINGKVYVGSHSWKNEGIDPDYYGSGTAITRAVKKYGKENFQVEVLYYYDTIEECRQDEERILTEYNVRDCPHSYNLKNSAMGWTSEDMKGENNPNYGKNFSKEYRKKMSQAHNDKKIPVVAIQKDTGKIRAFESIIECARQLNLYQRSIHHCLKGKIKQTGGYVIKYVEQLESGIYEGITDLTLEPSKNTPTPVIAICIATGRVRMFLSQRECGRVLEIDQGNINKCLKGRQKQTGGYTFKYAELP